MMGLVRADTSVAACPSEEDLAVLLDASAAAALVPRLLAHLDVCDDCRDVAAALARTTRDHFGTSTPLLVVPALDGVSKRIGRAGSWKR